MLLSICVCHMSTPHTLISDNNRSTALYRSWRQPKGRLLTNCILKWSPPLPQYCGMPLASSQLICPVTNRHNSITVEYHTHQILTEQVCTCPLSQLLRANEEIYHCPVHSYPCFWENSETTNFKIDFGWSTTWVICNASSFHCQMSKHWMYNL